MLLQTYWQGRWHDAATLSFAGKGKDARVQIDYLWAYLQQAGVRFDSRCEQAVTVNAPVTVIETAYPRWPGLLDDLLPAGKTRQWWLARLDISHLNAFEADCLLLAKTCMSPVGNVRVKDAVLAPDDTLMLRFPLMKVCQLEHDFLEYANSRGAAVGGATGAAGVAPKLLLMVDGNEVYIDGDFAGKAKTGSPYLVKFARNLRTERDNNILRAEAAYYRVLPQLLANSGIRTINTAGLQLYDVDGHVSLWLPRFDVEEHNGMLHRLGMESVYSVIDAGPGSAWDHFDVVKVLWQRLEPMLGQNRQQFVTEYVMRDLLNLVFGNSDNHGRNMSFLKSDGKVTYAPVYDFAPMKADPEQVTRLFKWGRGAELAGEVDFVKVTEQLADLADAQELLTSLRQLALQLLDAPTLLAQAGCPAEILNFPAIGFAYLPDKLKRMKLL